MKKFFLFCLMLTFVVMAQAQVKISPSMVKGTKMVYTSDTKTETMGTTIRATSELEYEVAEANAKGSTVNITMTKMDTKGGDKMTSMMLNMTQQMLKGVTIGILTDKEGKVTGVKNFNDVKKRCTDVVGKMVDELYKENPQMTAVMPKDKMVMDATSNMKAEELLKGVAMTPTSALALNGMTIRNLSQDTYVNAQNIPMKRTFFVTNGGKTITANSESYMTKEETKAYILKQVEQTMPDQVEAVRKSLDAMIAGGMMKVEAKEKVIYEMQDNGWMRSADMTSEINIMGQKIKIAAKVSLK